MDKKAPKSDLAHAWTEPALAPPGWKDARAEVILPDDESRRSGQQQQLSSSIVIAAHLAGIGAASGFILGATALCALIIKLVFP